MPLFIQALPLSFQTFWRYLILLPFLAIAAFIVSLASFIPILGSMVPGTISVGLTIVGLRCALSARGHGNALDISGLLTVSLIFCAINIVVDQLLGGVHLAMLWGVTQAGIELEPLGLLVGLLGGSYYWSAILLAMLSPTALVTAALAVPMTAAAFSATPRRGGQPVLFGLGSGIFGLMVVLAVWLFAGHMFTAFGEVWTTFGLVASAIWSWYQNEALAWELSLDPWSAFGSTIFMTWASSWFFATAVLTWERKVERQRAEHVAGREEARVSTSDIRALRNKRMQSTRGPLDG